MLCSTACQSFTSPHQPTGARSSETPNASSGLTPTPTATKPASTAITMCVAGTLSGWITANKQAVIPLKGAMSFGPEAVAQHAPSSFGQYKGNSSTGVGAADNQTGQITKITVDSAGSGGLGTMSFDAPWLVWLGYESQTDPNNWVIRSWNQESATVSTLATGKRSDGQATVGQAPIPVVSKGVATWAQPLPRSEAGPQSDVVALNLTTGDRRILQTGRVSSPVFASDLIVWGQVPSGGAAGFKAVDAATYLPRSLPSALESGSSILYLAGSNDRLAWGSVDGTSLHVWNFTKSSQTDITVPGRDYIVQFIHLSDHFALWFAGSRSVILDLDSGVAIDVRGEVAGSANAMVAGVPSSNEGGTGSSPTTGLVTWPSSTMHLGKCQT